MDPPSKARRHDPLRFGRLPAKICRNSRIREPHDESQTRRAPRCVISKCPLGKRTKLTVLRVSLNLHIPSLRIEFCEPFPESPQFFCCEALHLAFDVFYPAHSAPDPNYSGPPDFAFIQPVAPLSLNSFSFSSSRATKMDDGALFTKMESPSHQPAWPGGKGERIENGGVASNPAKAGEARATHLQVDLTLPQRLPACGRPRVRAV